MSTRLEATTIKGMAKLWLRQGRVDDIRRGISVASLVLLATKPMLPARRMNFIDKALRDAFTPFVLAAARW